MAELDREIATFERLRQDLELNQMSKWVLIRGDELVGIFDTMEATAEEAVRRFGRGPYLIRQVGAQPMAMPASVMFRSLNA